MSKLVRATFPNGRTGTVSEAYAKRKGLKYDDAPTHDAHGRILPPSKPRTDLAGKPATPKTETKEGGK